MAADMFAIAIGARKIWRAHMTRKSGVQVLLKCGVQGAECRALAASPGRARPRPPPVQYWLLQQAPGGRGRQLSAASYESMLCNCRSIAYRDQ